jgi:hypothetical protein
MPRNTNYFHFFCKYLIINTYIFPLVYQITLDNVSVSCYPNSMKELLERTIAKRAAIGDLVTVTRLQWIEVMFEQNQDETMAANESLNAVVATC